MSCTETLTIVNFYWGIIFLATKSVSYSTLGSTNVFSPSSTPIGFDLVRINHSKQSKSMLIKPVAVQLKVLQLAR